MNDVTHVKEMQHGYFNITNVQHSSDETSQFYNIEFQGYNLTDMKYDILDDYNITSQSGDTYADDEQPEFEDIESWINGYGRITYFSAYGYDSTTWEPNPADIANNFVKQIREGRFVNGKLTGYGRIIESNRVMVGFFDEGSLYGTGIIFPSDTEATII